MNLQKIQTETTLVDLSHKDYFRTDKNHKTQPTSSNHFNWAKLTLDQKKKKSKQTKTQSKMRVATRERKYLITGVIK